MKTFRTMIVAAMALLASIAAKAQPALTIGNVSGPKGAVINLPVNLENGTEKIKGLQFDLALPEGVTIAGAPTATDRGEGFTAEYGDYRFYMYNSKSSEAYLIGENGCIMNIPILIDGETGTYEIGITKVLMTKVGEINDTPASDYTAQLTIGQALEDFQFYALDITVEEGATEATMEISLKNVEAVTSYSFDVRFPEGIVPVYDEEEEDYFVWSDRNPSKNYSIDFEYVDNSLSVEGGITKGSGSLTEGDGVLLTMKLGLNEAPGTYEIVLCNQKIGDETPTDYTVKLTVKGDAPIQQEYTLTATGDYQTLSLGYDAVVPNGMTVYTAQLQDSWVALTKQDINVLPKNTGVVVKAAEGEYTLEMAESEADNLEGDNILLPTGDNGLEMGDDVAYAYVLAKVNGSESKFYRYKDFLPANKAYFGWTSSSAPAYINIKRDEATGIDAAATIGQAEYYDLSGRKTGSAKRGLTIQKSENGNRIVIKR